jgi:N-acetylglucosaminyl-diphospho-decaprenol L-rhamnosyltransferase
MKLSIIIVNYNSGAMTASCIESILPQLSSLRSLQRRGYDRLQHAEAVAEIIVVDNDSKEDSVPFLRSDFPEIMVIANDQNRGFGSAVNQGLEVAKGEYYLVLNPDIIALPGSLQELVSFMDTHRDVGLSGGKLLYPNDQLQDSCFRFYTLWTVLARRTWLGRLPAGQREIHRFLMKDFDHASAQEVDWLMGSCLMARAQAVEQVGGMDEQFFMYFEDVDWARRFSAAGWRVMYTPSAKFSHFHQQSSRQHGVLGILTNRATREHIKSAVKYFLKHGVV